MAKKFFKISGIMKPVEWSSDACIGNCIADCLHFGDIFIFDGIVNFNRILEML